MSRFRRYFGVLALVGLAAASLSAGSASAATQHNKTKAEWQGAIAQVPQPGRGCYHASYPVLQWHAARCAVAPKWPVAPALPAGSVTRAAPLTVGNGVDYVAQVSGLISKATGTFHNVSRPISEKGKVGNAGLKVANAFSLQLNSQFFSGSPACSGSSNPSGCLAWQQFVYSYQSSTGFVYMQYWLVYYNATCPAGWNTYSTTNSTWCWVNSPASTVTPLTARELHAVKFSGSAASGGNDGVSLTVGTGTATLVTNSDSMLDLASFWNGTEWGVFGDGGGGEAFFGASTTLEAETVLKATSSAAPACTSNGFTAETNNLTLTGTPTLGSKTSPTMASEQTNGTIGTASCAVAG